MERHAIFILCLINQAGSPLHLKQLQNALDEFDPAAGDVGQILVDLKKSALAAPIHHHGGPTRNEGRIQADSGDARMAT